MDLYNFHRGNLLKLKTYDLRNIVNKCRNEANFFLIEVIRIVKSTVANFSNMFFSPPINMWWNVYFMGNGEDAEGGAKTPLAHTRFY